MRGHFNVFFLGNFCILCNLSVEAEDETFFLAVAFIYAFKSPFAIWTPADQMSVFYCHLNVLCIFSRQPINQFVRCGIWSGN